MQNHRLTRRQFFSQFAGKTAIPQNTTDFVSLPYRDKSGYTPTENFFRHQTWAINPIVVDQWSLSIGGLIVKPLKLTYDDLLAMPALERPCTVTCAGMNAHNTLIGHGLWNGTPFSSIMKMIEMHDTVRYAQFISMDGYSTYLPINQLDHVLLAYGMNHVPLPHEHGYPLRLIAPGLYGYKMPKWIQRITFTQSIPHGVWEAQGWSPTGEVQPTIAIFTPRHLETLSGTVELNGAAFAGVQPIQAVEISLDGGAWMPVQTSANATDSWTPWQIQWTPTASGDYQFTVRVRTEHAAAQQSVVVRVTP